MLSRRSSGYSGARIGPSNSIIAGLPAESSYYLQVSSNDNSFADANIVISIFSGSLFRRSRQPQSMPVSEVAMAGIVLNMPSGS